MSISPRWQQLPEQSEQLKREKLELGTETEMVTEIGKPMDFPQDFPMDFVGLSCKHPVNQLYQSIENDDLSWGKTDLWPGRRLMDFRWLNMADGCCPWTYGEQYWFMFNQQWWNNGTEIRHERKGDERPPILNGGFSIAMLKFQRVRIGKETGHHGFMSLFFCINSRDSTIKRRQSGRRVVMV